MAIRNIPIRKPLGAFMKAVQHMVIGDEKQIFNNPAYRATLWLSLLGVTTHALEYVLRHWYNADGDLIAPRILRHHLADFGNPLLGGAMLNRVSMGLSELGEKSRPIVAGAIPWLMGMESEIQQSIMRNKPLDLGDVGAYTAGFLLFVGLSKWVDWKNRTSPVLIPDRAPRL